MKKLLPILLVFIIACGGEEAPKDLEQAAFAMSSMMAPMYLSRSAFSAGFPDGKPSEFVSYVFSDMGTAEWPPPESLLSEAEKKHMGRISGAALPDGVAIVPLEVDPDRGRQLVIGFDDSRNVVSFKGYTDPSLPPVLHTERELKSVPPTAIAEESYRSSMSMGVSDQAF